MIGVRADLPEQAVVREFFELLKTPWEFYRSGCRYEVVLCSREDPVSGASGLFLVYGGGALPCDVENGRAVNCTAAGGRTFTYRDSRVPIYGAAATFCGGSDGLLADECSGEPGVYRQAWRDTVVLRVGYDLFAEVRTLLQQGQPAANGAIPTLDLHIALLRELIVAGGASLAEIPPVPEGYRFIACLTHDVDHPSLRKHRGDRTMFGFLYRATAGSLLNLLRGRIASRQTWTNWLAALTLPLVYLGLVRDWWETFENYPGIEGGARSSFFVIPVKGYAGRSHSGGAPRSRASGYGAGEIAPHIARLKAAGCEIGLHGIDAWLDGAKGAEEIETIRRITGDREIGVRMHWLYFQQDSPPTLEQAGADYDSSVGYNETVGYRAGTGQAYRPLNASRLLELPLHVMDTALFYSGRLNLSPQAAWERVVPIIDNAVRFGGCVTVNWHDRSLAPERLWGEFYRKAVDELRRRGAWFATAGEAVSWFRERRQASFENASGDPREVRVRAAGSSAGLPGLQLRIHQAADPERESCGQPVG